MSEKALVNSELAERLRDVYDNVRKVDEDCQALNHVRVDSLDSSKLIISEELSKYYPGGNLNKAVEDHLRTLAYYANYMQRND